MNYRQEIHKRSDETKDGLRLLIYCAVAFVVSQAVAFSFSWERVEGDMFLRPYFWRVSSVLWVHTFWIAFCNGVLITIWEVYKTKKDGRKKDNELQELRRKTPAPSYSPPVIDEPGGFIDYGEEYGGDQEDMSHPEWERIPVVNRRRRQPRKSIGYSQPMSEKEKLAKAYAAGMKAAYKNLR